MTDKQLAYIEDLIADLDLEEEDALTLANLSEQHQELSGLTVVEASELIEALLAEKNSR